MSTDSAPEAPRLFSVNVAALRLGISRRSLERLAASGEFPRFLKIGRASRVPESDIAAFIAKLDARRPSSP